MPYEVTSHPDMSEALRPDAFYPQIQSNGAVSTDEEDPSDSDSSASSDGPPRPNRTAPTHRILRRLNYPNQKRNNRFHMPKRAPTNARLARDDEDVCVGAAKA